MNEQFSVHQSSCCFERNDSTHKGVNQRSQYVTQVQQQRTSTLGLVLFHINFLNETFSIYECLLAVIFKNPCLDYCRKGELGSNRKLSEVVGVNVCGWQDVQVNYSPTITLQSLTAQNLWTFFSLNSDWI